MRGVKGTKQEPLRNDVPIRPPGFHPMREREVRERKEGRQSSDEGQARLRRSRRSEKRAAEIRGERIWQEGGGSNGRRGTGETKNSCSMSIKSQVNNSGRGGPGNSARGIDGDLDIRGGGA